VPPGRGKFVQERLRKKARKKRIKRKLQITRVRVKKKGDGEVCPQMKNWGVEEWGGFG